MKIFARDRAQEEAEGAPTPNSKEEAIDGDRGIPSINRARSVQSRVSSLLAITLMSTLGLGLLTWYYAKTLTRPSQVQHAAQAAAKTRAQGDMPLPPLGPIESPFAHKALLSRSRPRRQTPLQWRECSDLRPRYRPARPLRECCRRARCPRPRSHR